jgi:hypothetical protein
MSDTQLLQAILEKVDTIDKKVDGVSSVVVKNGERLDKLGLELAKLQDDAPTIEEFAKRVSRLEKIFSN